MANFKPGPVPQQQAATGVPCPRLCAATHQDCPADKGLPSAGEALSEKAAHPAGPRAPHSAPVKKPKIPADREQPTLLVPSAVRSPGNLRRKTSTCLSSSSRHGPGDGCFAGRGMKLGEPWAVLTGASQGSIRPWTDGQFLNS